ncbi:carboxypeptidase regulatory-like domain-containing protein [Parafilimonas sp.]|uniref:TonB-dependent receptor n=1 Tax=Parafilimonas sp. TaxID=1969739 RepID=UPI0039E4E35D
MHYLKRLLLLLVAIISLQRLTAQETTATLNGIVTDAAGAPIAGATVQIKHEPTGTATNSITNNKGRMVVPNLRVGGPYTITISFVGFENEVLNDINLSLGENPDLAVSLKSSSNELKEVTVAAGRKTPGSGLTVSRAQISSLPSLGRSLSDFTRLTPQSNNNSFAGTNFRYNNFTLDGAINNDAIGFSNSFGGQSGGGQSGTAGAGTRTNPYSIETIQEVQVQLAPYDVKLGNFTGGSVNAVTKSGTNDFHGSVYGYGRNQALVGKSVDGLKTKIGSDFHDYQAGFTVGGPIVKNKAFFFLSYELTRRQEPTFYNAGDVGAAMTTTEAEEIVSFMKSTYNYDPGTYGKYKIFTKSDKIFGRFDFNISPADNLMIRALYTSGRGNNIERTTTNFQFSSTDFTLFTKNLNLVAELKSKLSNSVSNQAVVSYIAVHEYRTYPAPLAADGSAFGTPATPFISIDNDRIWLGTWREASIYNMYQKTFEFTDNLTWTRGINKFTFGTHNEFYNLTYGFLNSWNGRWEYSSGLTAFLASQPSRVRGVFPLDSDVKNDRNSLYNNVPGSNYKVNLTSLYAQDELSLGKGFKLTPGIRIDYPFLGKKLSIDTALNSTPDYVSSNPTYSHTPFSDLNNKWLGTPTFSPRVGFNWDIKGNQSLILRGGTGIFVGRMPFAWLGYASTLTGATYGNIDYKPSSITMGLAMDPTTLKDTVSKYGGTSASATRELDVVDNNFKLPAIWRSNVALDIKFNHGYKLTLDAMYTKTLYDVKFQQINIKDSTVQYFTTGPTQTPVYGSGSAYKNNTQYSNIYFLTNTKEGYRYNLTAQLSKVTPAIKLGTDIALNLNWMLAYTYGLSKDVSNGIRNSFQSNYELNPTINPENASLAYSNFDLRHRIVGTIGGAFHWNEMNTTSITFFYSGQSGNPYSLIYTSSPFNNSSNAPLPYIPKNSSDINLADITDASGTVTKTAAQQWTELNNFISNDKYLSTRRGKYAERNGLRTPWNHELDLKLMHEFRLSRTNNQHILTISFDIFNVLNLLNNDWGHITFVTNVNNYTVNFLKFVKDANGVSPGLPSTGYTPTFNFLAPSTGVDHYYTNDPINSRWQGQFGIKYSF